MKFCNRLKAAAFFLAVSALPLNAEAMGLAFKKSDGKCTMGFDAIAQTLAVGILGDSSARISSACAALSFYNISSDPEKLRFMHGKPEAICISHSGNPIDATDVKAFCLLQKGV